MSSQDKKASKTFLFGDEATQSILAGAKLVYDAVSVTYGPKGANCLIEKSYGFPVLTRDGNAVAREVYVDERAVNMGTQLLLEASNHTNSRVGDGNTQTIVLTYNLLRLGLQQIAAGVNPMELRDTFKADSIMLRKVLDELSKPVKKGQLAQVASVSCGDKDLGELIAEAVEEVGPDGGIIWEKAMISGIERKFIKGYFMQQGFQAIQQGKKEVENCYVVVSAKPVNSAIDAIQILNAVGNLAHEEQGIPDPRTPLQQPLRIAFIGEFDGDAYNTIIANIQKGAFDGVVVKSLPVGDMAPKYLDDVAIYTGAKMLTSADNLNSFDSSFIGKAEKVSATVSESTIFGGAGTKEDVDIRIAEIKDRIENEESDAIIEKLHDRIAKLEGRIAMFRIGGATDTEKEELEFRVEDAVQATKAAAQYGVVPGGGVTLLELSRSEGLSPTFSEALQACFRKLMDNAGYSGEVKLNEALSVSYGYGFNLRGEDEVVDLVKAGILDPTMVLEEVIKNAASTAGNALTIGCAIIFTDKDSWD